MKNDFAKNLKMLRTEHKMSQQKLAERVGVTQQCVSEWEHGKIEPTLTYLWLIGDLFEISIDLLCGRKEW